MAITKRFWNEIEYSRCITTKDTPIFTHEYKRLHVFVFFIEIKDNEAKGKVKKTAGICLKSINF